MRTWIFMLIFSLTLAVAHATDIAIGGVSGLTYRGECENTIGQRFKFSGISPNSHLIGSRRPLIKCSIIKASTKGFLKVAVHEFYSDGSEKFSSVEDGASYELPEGKLSLEIRLTVLETDHHGKLRELGSDEEYKSDHE